MELTVVNGTDLIMLVNDGGDTYKPVAAAMSHSIAIANKLRPTTSKSSGKAEGRDYGKHNITGSVDGLLVEDTSVINFDWLQNAARTKTKIKLISVQQDASKTGIPLDDDTGIDVADNDDAGTIDDETDSVSTTGDLLKVGTGLKAYYLVVCIGNVEKAGGDDENATFSMSFEADGDMQPLDIEAAA